MYAMKGLLNSQFRTAFIAALQRLYQDERFIAQTYRELASQEQENERRILLTRLARIADLKKDKCGNLLRRLGAFIPLDSRYGWKRRPYPLGQEKGGLQVGQLERIEHSDFGKLAALCCAQRRWV